ncbi:DNA polymerase III subunit gamma/tau [Halioxenophilus aromaticivorans]|uniref:DNA-directed DNA polymerase n=1 Tax=Halioxenophilus aromaticivorans TaxID=1306992 RepID=A0AAV3U031_9ALTE
MSYQVLARKWRPRNFHEMVGQEHVLTALVNALDHNRLHHAYLFTGTRGVGKTTIARIFAKCLNCESGISSNPCGTCSSCVEIAEGRFVDLIEVDAASRTKVEDTRELLDNVQYAPTRGRFKVYLIDEVHMLSGHSFNALLKTLEEPPPHVKFLLATTDPQKLPVTILSRCLQFHLKNMSQERIVGYLSHVLGQEDFSFEEPALWQLARAADGSMRDALSLTDQAIAFGNGQVNEAQVSTMLGTIDQAFIHGILTALAELNGKQVLAAVAAMSEQSPDYAGALADIIGVLHRVALAQTVPDALDNSLGDKEQVARLAQTIASEDVQLFYQIALHGRKDLAISPDPRAGFEMTLLRMLAFKPQGVTELPTQPLPDSSKESSEAGTKQKAEQKAEPPSQPPVATTPTQDTPQPTQASAPAPLTAPVAPAEPAVSPQNPVQQPMPAQSAPTQPASAPPAMEVPPAIEPPADHPQSNAAPEPASAGIPAEAPNSPPASAAQVAAAPSEPNAPTVAAQLDEPQPLELRPAEPRPAEPRPAEPRPAEPQPVEAEPAQTSSVSAAVTAAAQPSPPQIQPGYEASPPVASEDEYFAGAGGMAHLSDLAEPEVPARRDEPVSQESAAPPGVQQPSEVQKPQATMPSPASQLAQVLDAPATRQPAVAKPRRAAPEPADPKQEYEIIPLAQFCPDNWLALYPQLKVTGVLQSTVSNSVFTGREGDTLHFDLQQANATLYSEEHQQRFADILSEYFSQPLAVSIRLTQVSAETPAAQSIRLKVERHAHAVALVQGDPLVQRLVQDFAAEVDPEKIEPTL